MTRAAAKPSVTIFADASHDHRAKVGGWAAWIKADGALAVIYSAAFKEGSENPSTAELCALANALALADLRGLLRKECTVMLQSDCAHALCVIRGQIAGTEDRPAAGGLETPISRRKPKGAEKTAIAAIRAIVESHSLVLVTRHVRGHRSGDGRQWVNRKVDQLARKAMRAARANRNTEGESVDHDGI